MITSTIPTTTTLAERARAAHQKQEEARMRKLQAQHERDRKQCQVTLAEILELPLDAVTVVDHRVEGRLHFKLPFTATVDGLKFVFHVFGDPRTVYVHLVPGVGVLAPFDLSGDPLEHYSRSVTSLADLGCLLECFEPHYI
jgi:hypothetical protein